MVNRGQNTRARSVILNTIRLFLFAALLFGLLEERWLIFLTGIFGLFITLLPSIYRRIFHVDLPASFDIVVVLFLFGIIYLSKVRGWYFGFSFIHMLFGIIFGVLFGIVALSVLSVLYYEERIKAHPLIIALFAFCFAISIGTSWELLEFGLDYFLNFKLQEEGLNQTMSDLFFIMIGSGIISLSGYYHLRRGKSFLMSEMVAQVVRRHSKLFEPQHSTEQKNKKILELIKNGENRRVEFKSTLRTNLHTNQIDQNIEHSALKTVVAYLNSDGGILFIGVDNLGNIVGIEKDNFVDKDKLGLHLTNLIKQHVGPEYLPFIEHEVVELDGKRVLKVECKKSPKEVFLRQGKDEHFYVRNGPATMSLHGKALVDYIENKFR